MSNLYVTEPGTNGKVIVETTAGEIEVELWGKEAPLAVRNFLALSMEGYYDGVVFHRIVPGFIVQTGDPTGTGLGGESFYGEKFKDEVHGRLKFNRRGLLGMANSGKRNTNGSQFFFTLDRADELTGKHTLFGKVVGNTIYNVVNIGNLEVDAEERPLIPPKIKTIRIIENPFDDIVPRITAAEKRAQQQAKLEAKRESEARAKKARALKKNTGLLSFGDSEEIPEEAVIVKKKGIGREDLVETVPEKETKSSKPKAGPVPAAFKEETSPAPHASEAESSKPKKSTDIRDIRAQHQREKESVTAARQAEIKKMQDNLRQLKKRTGEASDSESDSDDARRRRKGPSALEQELSKYAKGRGLAKARAGNRKTKREEEDDILTEMALFSKKVAVDADFQQRPKVVEEDEGPAAGEIQDVDNDADWFKHELKFEVDEKELTRRAEAEYAVIDPRAKAREIAQQEQRDKGRERGRGNP